MGAYLNKPVTEKEAEEGENEWLKFASTSMQGWRAHQEDSHNCIPDFENGCSLFAVYDGHGGAEVAVYIAKNFPQFLKKSGLLNSGDLVEALKKCFIDFDVTLKDDEVIQIMNTIKDSEGTASRAHGLDEDEEREQLFEEALSKEASVSIESIIMQYAKIRSQMGGEPKIVFMEESKSEKRALGEPSSLLIKRRRIHRDNAVLDAEEVGEGGSATADSGSAPSGCETSAMKVNGSLSDVSSNDAVANGEATSSHTAELENANSSASIKINGEEKDPATCEETVTSSTSVKIPASKSSDLDNKTNVEEPDSNTDEEDDDEDYEASGDGEEGEVVDESESEDDETDSIDVNDAAENKPGFDSGATACVALLFREKVVVANVGDSRAVLCREGKALDLSVDHKPEDAIEKARIEKAGGIVSEDGRVNGGLNLSRALGDHYYKQNSEVPFSSQMISSVPDVVESNISEKDTLLIVACDGIWNSLSSQEVVDFVSKRLGSMSLKEIGAQICDHCCAPDTSGDGTGCDNMTIIIVDLKKESSAVCDLSYSNVNQKVEVDRNFTEDGGH